MEKFFIQTFPFWKSFIQNGIIKIYYKLSYPSIMLIEVFLEECNGKPKKPLHKNCVQKSKFY